jgi:tetratricopeptide (TPR) repeat protein
VCAALVAVLGAGLVLAGDERDRMRDALATQAALDQGLEHLQRGRFAEAVTVLEKRIALIDGNRRYLMALRDAYRGFVKQLEAEKRYPELKLYQGRLAILDSPGQSDRPAATYRAVSRDDPAAPARVDDPFAESNRAGATNLGEQRAHRLVEQAEKAFEQKQYESAAQWYGQAHRLAPGSVADCRERWAYCRLYAAAQAVNRGTVEQLADLEHEVKAALALAPRLDGFAQKILKDLEEVSAARVAVKHTPRQGNSWAVAQTASIRVYHAGAEELAEKVVRIAETTRLLMTRKWFGEAAVDWSPGCTIYLHPTAQSYARATGARTTDPGHSTYKQEGERVLERRIDLPADNPNLLTAVLPHEVTHIVLVGRFGRHYVPRWADEGMAVLSEPRARVNLHLANLPQHRRDGTLFTMRDLMAQDDYPKDRQRVTAFYAQCVSVVEFLCQKKGPATFARFLRAALDGGCEPALERHYGYHSFADLESDWKQHALDAAVATLSEERP